MKVYFAGDPGKQENPIYDAGVRYRLLSYLDAAKDGGLTDRAQQVWAAPYTQLILDSGLFTFLWGVGATREFDIDAYVKAYAQFVNTHLPDGAVAVECDCAPLVGRDRARAVRRALRKLVHDHIPIMNVYHLDEGSPDATVDASDYVAVSVPELRRKVTRAELVRITDYVVQRALRRGARVHLLGCTAATLLRRFCIATTCDSTSWLGAVRYNRRVGTQRHFAPGEYGPTGGDSRTRHYWRLRTAAQLALEAYTRYAGDQS